VAVVEDALHWREDIIAAVDLIVSGFRCSAAHIAVTGRSRKRTVAESEAAP